MEHFLECWRNAWKNLVSYTVVFSFKEYQLYLRVARKKRWQRHPVWRRANHRKLQLRKLENLWNSQEILRLDPQNHHESMNHHFDEKKHISNFKSSIGLCGCHGWKVRYSQVHCAMPLCCWFWAIVPFWESFLIPPQPTSKTSCEILSKNLLFGFEGGFPQICDYSIIRCLPESNWFEKTHSYGIMCIFIILIILKHYIFSYTMAYIDSSTVYSLNIDSLANHSHLWSAFQ